MRFTIILNLNWKHYITNLWQEVCCSHCFLERIMEQTQRIHITFDTCKYQNLWEINLICKKILPVLNSTLLSNCHWNWPGVICQGGKAYIKCVFNEYGKAPMNHQFTLTPGSPNSETGEVITQQYYVIWLTSSKTNYVEEKSGATTTKKSIQITIWESAFCER